MKRAWNGWLLALQLFTIIPIQRSIEWNAPHVRWLVRTMPLAGALLGTLAALVYGACAALSFGPPSFLALLLLWLGIWLAGGLHADGFMDVSDAFFRTGTPSGGKRSWPIRASARSLCCRSFVCYRSAGCFCMKRSKRAFPLPCLLPFHCCREPGLSGFFPPVSWPNRQEWRPRFANIVHGAMQHGRWDWHALCFCFFRRRAFRRRRLWCWLRRWRFVPSRQSRGRKSSLAA